MRLVAKNLSGEAYGAIGELPADAAQLLRAWWADGRASSDTRRQKVGAVLARVAEQKAWIACDCLDGPGAIAQDPPVLFPREKDGVFTIQRGTTAGRAEHARHCPFHWDEGEMGLRQSARPGGPAALSRTMDFILYKRTGEVASEHTIIEGRRGQGGRRRDALQERLFHILDLAGVNRFEGNEPEGDDRKRIREACAAVSLYDEVDLEDIVWTSPKWLTEGWAVKKLKRLRTESGWPGNVPMQGFVLVSAKDVSGNRVTCENGEILELERPANVFAGAEPARSPYVVLVSAKLDEAGGRLRLVRAYAHPRYTDSAAHRWSLCPVDSDAERQALGALLYVSRKTAGEGAGITIEKPLFDRVPPGSDEGCRPDFVVRACARMLCVETMGSQDPEYRARKTGTHALMRRLGTLIEDERAGVDHAKANKILIAKIFAVLKG